MLKPWRTDWHTQNPCPNCGLPMADFSTPFGAWFECEDEDCGKTIREDPKGWRYENMIEVDPAIVLIPA